MKFLIAIILIALCSAVTEYFLPWWVIAPISFLVVLAIRLKPRKAFMAGFWGIGLFWLIAALMKDIRNEHILSARMAALFHLPGYVLFIAVTVIVGGLVGGLSAWAASFFRTGRR
jgi:hypothetical protein